jgi:hypothetical protein
MNRSHVRANASIFCRIENSSPTTYGWKPGHANFVGIPFETIEEALAAVAKEATS